MTYGSETIRYNRFWYYFDITKQLFLSFSSELEKGGFLCDRKLRERILNFKYFPPLLVKYFFVYVVKPLLLCHSITFRNFKKSYSLWISFYYLTLTFLQKIHLWDGYCHWGSYPYLLYIHIGRVSRLFLLTKYYTT